jgi:copper homeostasis protein
MAKIGLEVCVDGPAGLMAAVRGGASRIELCSALALGGLTPSPGFMRLAATTGVGAYPMLRPHPGPFVYGSADLDVIRDDLEAVKAAGLPGAVIGANLASGDLDLEGLEMLCRHARDLSLRLALHRAFDLVPDQARALEQAIDLGFERVLTSGGARTAPEGVDRLAALVAQAAGRISIMPGSGLNPSSLAEVMRRTGAAEAHGSCGRAVADRGLAGDHLVHAERLGFISSRDRETDQASVEAMVAILAGVARERDAN